MAIELFNVVYRPGLVDPPISLLCQAVDVAGEKFLWMDGINAEDPVMVSISAVTQIQPMGAFKDFVANRMELAAQVINESLGEHSPTILARAILYMSSDRTLTAADAIETAEEQALDILEADSACSAQLGVAVKHFEMARA